MTDEIVQAHVLKIMADTHSLSMQQKLLVLIQVIVSSGFEVPVRQILYELQRDEEGQVHARALKTQQDRIDNLLSQVRIAKDKHKPNKN